MPNIGVPESAKDPITTSDDAASNDHRWLLIAEGGWMVGQRFTLGSHTVLGRDSNCDITIPGTHLSRQHAELAITGNRLYIRDLDSANGTYVNEKAVKESELKSGDTVRFDVLVFRIHGPGPGETTNEASARQLKQPAPIVPAGKVSPTAEKTANRIKPSPVSKQHSALQPSTIQKATQSLGTLLAVIVGTITLVAIGYLLTQL